jgi:hypothetical protein
MLRLTQARWMESMLTKFLPNGLQKCLLGLLVVLFAGPVLVPSLAQAQDATARLGATPLAGKGKKPAPSAAFPISGNIRFNPQISGGTLQTGEGRRPALDLIFGWQVGARLLPGLSLSASQLVSKNIATNVDAATVREYDTTFGNIFLSLGWRPQVSDGAGGTTSLQLPGQIGLSFGVNAVLPTSRAARYQGLYTQLLPNASLSRLFGKLSVSYNFGFFKNFNKYTSAVVPRDEFPQLARPNGAESLGSFVATGQNLSSFGFRNILGVGYQISGRLSASVSTILFEGYRYYGPEQDQYTGRYAKSGRGRGESLWGIVSVSYALDEAGKTNLSLTSFTAAPPKTADNKSFRFPFWDFRSLADNYSSLGLELSRAF